MPHIRKVFFKTSFDRLHDPGENKDLYAAKTAQGERLLQMLAANAAESSKHGNGLDGEQV